MSDHPLRARRTLGAQIAEVRREIQMRHKVYPGLVFKRRMSQGEADELILLLENVLATLLSVAEADGDESAAQYRDFAARR